MKRIVIVTILALSISMTACQKEISIEENDNDVKNEMQLSDTEQDTAEENEGNALTETKQEEETDAGQKNEMADDNFTVEKQEVIDFAGKVKEAVLEEDMEKLADLTSFPTYVGFKGEGIVVETREDFLALDKEKVFTVEMLDSIKEADVATLEPSMAGFTLQKASEEIVPGITFGMEKGILVIKGINY